MECARVDPHFSHLISILSGISLVLSSLGELPEEEVAPMIASLRPHAASPSSAVRHQAAQVWNMCGRAEDDAL